MWPDISKIRILPVCCTLESLTAVYCGEVLFWPRLTEFLWVSYVWMFISFSKFGNFSAIFHWTNFLSHSFFSPFLWRLPKLKCWFVWWYPRDPEHCLRSSQFFFFSSPSEIFQRPVFRIRYLSSAGSSQLLKFSTASCIWLISTICVWVSRLISLCWSSLSYHALIS